MRHAVCGNAVSLVSLFGCFRLFSAFQHISVESVEIWTRLNIYKNDFTSMFKSRFDDNDAVAYWCICMPTFLLGTNVLCNQLLKSVTNKRKALSKLTTKHLIRDANFWH